MANPFSIDELARLGFALGTNEQIIGVPEEEALPPTESTAPAQAPRPVRSARGAASDPTAGVGGPEKADQAALDAYLERYSVGSGPASFDMTIDELASEPASQPTPQVVQTSVQSSTPWAPPSNPYEDQANASQKRLGILSLISDAGQGFDQINQAFGAKSNGPTLQATMGAEQERIKRAMQQAATLREQQKDSDPNDPRAVALRNALKQRGIAPTDGMGYGDVIQSGLVQQDFVSQRDAAQREAMLQAQSDRREAELSASDRDWARQQERDATLHGYDMEKQAARRPRGGGGGAGSAQSNYSADAINARRDEYKAQGYTDYQIDEAIRQGPAGAARFFGSQIKNEGAQAASNSYVDSRGASHSIDDKAGKDLQKAMMARSKVQGGETIDTMYIPLRNINKLIGSDEAAFDAYLKERSVGDRLRKMRTFFGDKAAEKMQMFDQARGQLSEAYARAKSGAAINAQEWESFNNQLGMDKMTSLSLFKNGIKFLNDRLHTQNKSYAGNVANSPSARASYWKTVVDATGGAPWAKMELMKAESELGGNQGGAQPGTDIVQVKINGQMRAMPRAEYEQLKARQNGGR